MFEKVHAGGTTKAKAQRLKLQEGHGSGTQSFQVLKVLAREAPVSRPRARRTCTPDSPSDGRALELRAPLPTQLPPGGGRGRPHLRGAERPAAPPLGGPAHGPSRGAQLGAAGCARLSGRGRVQRAEWVPEPAALRWAPGVQGEGPRGREDGGGGGG